MFQSFARSPFSFASLCRNSAKVLCSLCSIDCLASWTTEFHDLHGSASPCLLQEEYFRVCPSSWLLPLAPSVISSLQNSSLILKILSLKPAIPSIYWPSLFFSAEHLKIEFLYGLPLFSHLPLVSQALTHLQNPHNLVLASGLLHFPVVFFPFSSSSSFPFSFFSLLFWWTFLTFFVLLPFSKGWCSMLFNIGTSWKFNSFSYFN